MKNLLAVLALCTLSIGQTAVLPQTTALPKTTIFGSVATGGPSVKTLVQSNGVAGAAGTSQSVTLSSSVAAGDLIKLEGIWGALAGTMAVTDNATGCTNTWLATPSSPISDGIGNEAFDWYTVNCGIQAGGLTVTMTVSGGGSHSIREGVLQYHSTTGWPASPLDQSSSASGGGATASGGNSGSITPTVTNTLITAVIQTNAAVTAASFSVTPCTEENGGAAAHTGFGGTTRAQGADILSGGTGATVCTWTWTGTVGWSGLISNYKPN